MNARVILSWSGGKDSALALQELRRSADCEVIGLLTTLTRDFERISMHGVRRELLHRQAASLGLPLEEVWIDAGASNAGYEQAMSVALQGLRLRGATHVAFGDLFLADIRAYRERLIDSAGLQPLFPLWGRPTAELARKFIAEGFRARICCLDTRVLGESLVGAALDAAFLDRLPATADPCGENGEFHSFVWGGPGFESEIPVLPGALHRKDSFLFCDLLLMSAPEAGKPSVSGEIVRTAVKG
jgi:uncharacterized protein (TIGR00290 family)